MLGWALTFFIIALIAALLVPAVYSLFHPDREPRAT